MSKGQILASGTMEFTRTATRRETLAERKRYENGRGCDVPQEVYSFPPGSRERAEAFARAMAPYNMK